MSCSRNQFKILAILFMFIDHIGAFLLGNQLLFRAVGRLAFPMFVFLLADGYRRTRNVQKYLGRLAVLFLLSIVPYSLACSNSLFYPMQNVYASLFMYLIMFCILGHETLPKSVKLGTAALCLILAYVLHLEYSWYGAAVAIFMFYLGNFNISTAFVILFILSLFYGQLNGFPVQCFAAFSLFLIPYQEEFIDSDRPSKALSLVNYLFYPIHLLFIWILRL